MKLNVPFEIKSASGRTITGHGSTFGNVDLGGDIVMPGTFKSSLAQKMPAMLWQHDSSQLPGVWKEVGEDQDGLSMSGELADTTLGRDVLVLAKMRAFTGMSIGGTITEDGFSFNKKGNRLIEEFDLWEVSLVTFPMNPQATIAAVKSIWNTPRQFEHHLKSVGCSNKLARELVHDLMGKSDARSDELDDQREVDPDVTEAVQATVDLITAATMRSVRSRIR